MFHATVTGLLRRLHIPYRTERSLEVKLPTIWTDGKAEVGRVREEKSRREKIREENEWEERRCRCEKNSLEQNAPCSDHFSKLRCRKRVCCCGAKHISKSKCTKHTIPGPLWGVEMSKKCTSLCGEAHFQVKMLKAPHVRTNFGRSDVVSRGRRKGLHLVKNQQNVKAL